MNAIDQKIGARIKERREELGLSTSVLAARLKVTEEELVAMEAGTQRVGSQLLYRLTGLLDVPITWFYRDLKAGEDASEGDPEAELVTLFRALPDDATREAALSILRGLAEPRQTAAMRSPRGPSVLAFPKRTRPQGGPGGGQGESGGEA